MKIDYDFGALVHGDMRFITDKKEKMNTKEEVNKVLCCPFCGSDAKLCEGKEHTFIGGYDIDISIECTECIAGMQTSYGKHGTYEETKEAAQNRLIEDWNKRQQLQSADVSDDDPDEKYLPGRLNFYREQMKKLRTYLNENNIGKPNQSFFDAMYDHIQDLKEKANMANFALESIAENEIVHQQIENIEVGDKDEEVKRLRTALEQLGKAVTEYMPNVDTQNEKQMKLYTSYHTTKQALNPKG